MNGQMNSNKNGSGASLAVAAFLSVFLIGILIYITFAFFKINEYEAGSAAIIFGAINMLAVGVVYGFGKVLSGYVGTPSYASIAGITGIYTIGQFVYMFTQFKSAKPETYILISLIILFVYCLIVLPIGVMGSRSQNR